MVIRMRYRIITPCFTHALVAAGYETGGGGTRSGGQRKNGTERGNLWGAGTFCLNYVGAGESCQNYDKMVIEQVLEYLEEPHEKPQFILVGTYGPHFPYITSKEMYLQNYPNPIPS
ncbi:MAG: sulfatase-like hydrolase/transferase [Roseburia inulinivorans]